MLKNLKQFNLPQIEEKVLSFWKSKDIFKKSLEKNNKGKDFIFYEGPPGANGMPGMHHMLSRFYKDLIPRYKTMRGFNVPRQAGWDTHGLPVEIAVEKELGIKNKDEIEEYGIAKFNAKAKELVFRYKDNWNDFTQRIGYWLDIENPYMTCDSDYMESLWWIFARANKKGYLKQLQRTVPWCPRCQTPLSSHELGQPGVYQNVKDPSLYVKLRLAPTSSTSLITPNTFLLIWTTTPWTLPGNLAVAINKNLEYKKFKVTKLDTGLEELLISYNQPPEKEGYKIEKLESIKGGDLIGLEYEPLFQLPKDQLAALKGQDLYKVRHGDFVSTEDGTGLVHIAPSFGEDDYSLMGINEGLPITITDDGKMGKGFPGEGLDVKEADNEVVKDLDAKGNLYLFKKEKHEYPHCWRCRKPLIYMVRLSWFFTMSQLKDKLIKGNQKINWYPDHVKDGRFGSWLEEIKDWSVSRNRYWGTPLPIWVSEDGKEKIVAGSLKDLAKYALSKNSYYLMRHTQARANVENVIASGPETSPETTSELTEKGRADAEKLAKKLKKEKIDLIFASPYKRTQDTAKIIAKELGIEIITDNRLEELKTGVFSWRPISEFHAYFKSRKERFSKAPEGGENWNELRRRLINFYKEIDKKHQGKNILIVSHGDCLWMLEGAMRGLSDDELLEKKYYPDHEKWHEISSSNLPFNEDGIVDLHRPYIDEIKLKTKSGKIAKRVEDVADVWFDAGSMPYASHHFPFKKGKTLRQAQGKTTFRNLPFPADYIAEGLDQTRGWFYTLHAIAIMLGKDRAFKNVICHGLINDKHGKKMSKSLGNTVLPEEIIEKYGVDALRWYFFTLNDVGENKNFNEDDLAKTLRKIVLIIYNSYSFLETYGSDNKDISKASHVLDKWILAELNQLLVSVSEKLDNYQIQNAGREIEKFIDSLSRWYIRRSRDRFQSAAKSENKNENDRDNASAVLRHCLLELSKIMAPFTPFFSESLYKSLETEKESVHLENWPKAESALKDSALIASMEQIRALAAEALALRAENKIKVRQPLQSLIVKDDSLIGQDELLEILKDEINVKEIKFDAKLTSEKGIKLDTEINQALKEEGTIRELARAIQGLRQDANYKMSDKIALNIKAEGFVLEFAKRKEEELKQMVNAKNIEFKTSDKYDAVKNTKIADIEVTLSVRKI
ncbi:MAG: class I tRNA ligase family protein [bacterium]|nr:class I tRNA ligase family protein [bacterium]